jgi:hypothetical protein
MGMNSIINPRFLPKVVDLNGVFHWTFAVVQIKTVIVFFASTEYEIF